MEEAKWPEQPQKYFNDLSELTRKLTAHFHCCWGDAGILKKIRIYFKKKLKKLIKLFEYCIKTC